MTLTVYNTRTKKKEEFKPLEEGKVKLYVCGPTVYNFAHIGNLRSYIFADILRRSLKYLGYDLTHVMNITDVGHLTSDADEGEDKMLKGAKREGKTVWDIAEFYTDAFMDDMSKLNIQSPEVLCRATDHIKEMQELVQKILDNGFGYEAGGNIYFDTSTFTHEGGFKQAEDQDREEHARVDKDPNKKNSNDFVLWFTKSKFDDQEMKWDSPWGKGYPGWHIECSAMSSKYLGEQFDIHTGGIDHIAVHHANEIAQSEAAFGKKPWVNIWMHGEFLIIDKGKMAKSGENFITLQTLEDKGFNPLVYRFFLLQAHYRQPVQFSFEALENARNAFATLSNRIIEIKKDLDDKKGDDEKKKEFHKQFEVGVKDDLNIPKALAVMHTVIKDESISNNQKMELLLHFDSILGLGIDQMQREVIELDAEIEKLVLQREEARKNKDWATSDKIRDDLLTKGIVLEDTPEGVRWKKN